MMLTELLTIGVLLFPVFSPVLSTECVESLNPKTRTFSTLTELQTNKLQFDPRSSNGGNYVNFSFQAISALPKNAFITFDSEHIIKIFLNDKSIGKINDGAFNSLTCLKYLDLSNNKISTLEIHTFKDVGNLVSLDLSGNLLTNVPDLVFDNLVRLKVLNLSKNKITTINLLSFANLTNLEELYISSNLLTKIPEEVFYPLIKLTLFDISYNHIFAADSTKWGLKSLQNLNFAGNHLASFDPSLNYSYTGIKKLNLSDNSLVDLNVYWLRLHFTNLTLLDLNKNKWLCDDLARIIHELFDSRVTVIARNTTITNVEGIDCFNSTKDYIPIPDDVAHVSDPSTEVTSKTSVITPIANSSRLIADKIDKFVQSNNQILDKISSMNGLLALMFIFMIGCVLAFIFLSCGVGKQFVDRMHVRLNPSSVNADYSLLRT